jgi:glycosyltransferase involved in cell wall biosynthesis
MDNIELSVIVPVYNTALYLRECLDSICRQDFYDMEIILVDDGSTDGSPDICDEYSYKDNRIKVIHKRNEGLVRARKTGINAARGKYILYVDSDDWIEPGMIRTMYGSMAGNHVDMVLCGRSKDTGKTCRKIFQGFADGRYGREDLVKSIYPYMIVNGAFFRWGISPNMWDKMFRREILADIQNNVNDCLTMGEDAACSYPYMLKADSIYIINKCFYHYRQVSSSMTSRTGNADEERGRFSVLYRSVHETLKSIKNDKCILKQWKEYLLFLMLPRADYLYRGFDRLDYLFPFPDVRKGSRIIIYGAGEYGWRLYRYLQTTHFCEPVLLADINYAELNKQGIPARSPETINDVDCDCIVVPMSFADVRERVVAGLSEKYPDKKICTIDEELVKSGEALRAFGIAE